MSALLHTIRRIKKLKVYQKISNLLTAIENCQKSNNKEWEVRHTEYLESLQTKYFPTGSGFNGDCYIDIKLCKKDKITVIFEYQAMNDNGYYDGWLYLELVIKPAFTGFDLKIKWYGKTDQYMVRKYKPILEDYFYDTWYDVLNQKYQEDF